MEDKAGSALFRLNKSEKKFPDDSGIYTRLFSDSGYSANYHVKIRNHSLFKPKHESIAASSPSVTDYIRETYPRNLPPTTNLTSICRSPLTHSAHIERFGACYTEASRKLTGMHCIVALFTVEPHIRNIAIHMGTHTSP